MDRKERESAERIFQHAGSLLSNLVLEHTQRVEHLRAVLPEQASQRYLLEIRELLVVLRNLQKDT